jgi:hypothetical protein
MHGKGVRRDTYDQVPGFFIFMSWWLSGSVHRASFGGQGEFRIGRGEKVLYIVQNRCLGGVLRGVPISSLLYFVVVITPALSALRSNNRYKNRDGFRPAGRRCRSWRGLPRRWRSLQ